MARGRGWKAGFIPVLVSCLCISPVRGFCVPPSAIVTGPRSTFPSLSTRIPVGVSGLPFRSTRILGSAPMSLSDSSSPTVQVPHGFQEPIPRRFRPTGDLKGLVTGFLALLFRVFCGVFVIGYRAKLSTKPPEDPEEYCLRIGPLYLKETSPFLRRECPRPEGRLVLYEFDSSPFCRKVRDACTMLDLEVDIRPCPGALEGGHFSDEHLKLHGKRTVPYLIDEGLGMSMFGSDDIVNHLFAKYGPSTKYKVGKRYRDTVPFQVRGFFAILSAGMAAIIRGMPADKMQVDARPDNWRMLPLVLWGYEASPFCHPVREKLCSLGLPHTVVNCARGSSNRAGLARRTGKPFQVPYLFDPNTGVEMHESIDIRIYLDRVYTTSGYTPLRGGSWATPQKIVPEKEGIKVERPWRS